jgi:F-box protein 21
LTSRFYARKLLKYFRNYVIERKLKDMMALPEQDKSILVGAILISQWVQTEQEQMISLPAVELQLESITKRVTQLLADKNTSSTFTAKEVLDCINTVLYHEMGFKVMKSDYSFEYVFIDKVFNLLCKLYSGHCRLKCFIICCA